MSAARYPSIIDTPDAGGARSASQSSNCSIVMVRDFFGYMRMALHILADDRAPAAQGSPARGYVVEVAPATAAGAGAGRQPVDDDRCRRAAVMKEEASLRCRAYRCR
jgi:hypothetical protein